MTPRLEVLWHREIGDRLLVALEEEPTATVWECESDLQPRCVPEGIEGRCCGTPCTIPMPSGTRVELGYWTEEDSERWVSLGVATLEEVVPWGQPESYDAYACFAHVFRPTKDSGPVLRIVHRPPSDGPNPRRHTIYEPLRVDDLTFLSPKYVALCEVVS